MRIGLESNEFTLANHTKRKEDKRVDRNLDNKIRLHTGWGQNEAGKEHCHNECRMEPFAGVAALTFEAQCKCEQIESQG